MITPGVLLYIE